MATVERLDLGEFKSRVVAGSFPQFSQLSDALLGLRFVQADPIRSPARAQDLMLRQRVDGYVAGDLEKTFPELNAEEGYLFAYGFMTSDVWQHLRWRPRGKLKKLELDVLAAVAELGEVHPRGLDDRFGRKSVPNYWGGKSLQTKRVLDDLHHHGYLRVSRRENGIRVYQVPDESGDEQQDSYERYRLLALTTAFVFGPTTKRFLVSELRSQNHLLPRRADRLAAVESLVETGSLSEVNVEGVTYLLSQTDWVSVQVPERVRILTPFDPLVRDRSRFEQLWDWTYRFEAYLPAVKRERGYYAMPVLWNDEVVGWANAVVADQCLEVEFGYSQKKPRSKSFRLLAETEVAAMAKFLGLEDDAWRLKI
ncbi:MAG: crosslink repair DNA glycosylase YcaQ family protein [Fuerstiella sp.]